MTPLPWAPRGSGQVLGKLFSEKYSTLVGKGWERLETRPPVCSPLQVIRCPALQLHVSGPAMAASQEDFAKAMNQVKLLKEDPGNEVKLKLYALYKQVNGISSRGVLR